MNLQRADRIAILAVEALRPFCDQIEIAGSIRRRRPEVADVDIVALPKPWMLEPLLARCQENARLMQSGEQYRVFVLKDDTQLDLWIARPKLADLLTIEPGNFGMLLLSRTGSKEHNIKLAARAKHMALHFHPHRGIMRGPDVIASETEDEIFRALDLPFIAPENREA